MIWVNIVPMHGTPMRIAGYKGESLLDVITRNHVPGIFPDCLGGDKEGSMEAHQIPYDYYSMGVECAQCSVVIADEWADKVNKMHSKEEEKLTRRQQGNATNSRLACCIQMRPELNEMIVAVGNNQTDAAGEVGLY